MMQTMLWVESCPIQSKNNLSPFFFVNLKACHAFSCLFSTKTISHVECMVINLARYLPP